MKSEISEFVISDFFRKENFWNFFEATYSDMIEMQPFTYNCFLPTQNYEM